MEEKTTQKKPSFLQGLWKRMKALGRFTKGLIAGAVGLVVIALLLAILFFRQEADKISIETSLKEIVASSTFTTVEYTYNSIAEVKKGKTTKYYVAYSGTVTAGFDFEDIQIKREDKTIQIIVPDIQIQQINVDTDMDYIFIEEKYNTEKTYEEAYSACCTDLRNKANSCETLFETGRKSAEDTIKALTKPIESQLDDGESIVIVFDQQESDAEATPDEDTNTTNSAQEDSKQ